MKLERLQLKNFRCFGNLDIKFHKELTVIVANNGQGKTAILDAARIALWPYLHSFDLANGASANTDNSIRIDDVKLAYINAEDLVRHLPSTIKAYGNVLGVSKWERSRLKESPSSKTINDGGAKRLESEARNLQALVRQATQNQQTLPMLGYYGTGRLWDQKKRKKESKSRSELDSSMIRTYGYRDCLDPASSFKMFEDWFIRIFKAHLAELSRSRQRDSFSLDFETTRYSDAINVVRFAVDTVLEDTDWEYIDYDVFAESLKLTNKQNLTSLEIRQLSDGLRAVIGLVADIAYRCYQLNRHLGVEAATETQGIVLIDEVDMHLHPVWQQKILLQLRSAFPRIQFIVSTHSPQVLSTVSSECIRVLRWETDPETERTSIVARSVEWQTRGVASSDLLARIMGVDPVPSVPEAQWVADYHALIQQNLHYESEGLALREKLEAHFGSQHPVMHECDRMIRLQGFKQRLPRSSSDEGR